MYEQAIIGEGLALLVPTFIPLLPEALLVCFVDSDTKVVEVR